MEICECKNPPTEHHPSFHYAEKRDVLMAEVEEFIDAIYPVWLIGDKFTRKQAACVTACFILDRYNAGALQEGTNE